MWKTICRKTHCFEGRGHPATKINITFFVGTEVLNIFHLTIFLKKHNIFQNNRDKKFWGAWPFLRKQGVGQQQWIKPFVWEMECRILFLSFFFEKPYTIWLKPKKLVLGAHFSSYLWFYWANYFQKHRIHPWVDPHKPLEFHENRFKTVTCIVRSYTYIYT